MERQINGHKKNMNQIMPEKKFKGQSNTVVYAIR